MWRDRLEKGKMFGDVSCVCRGETQKAAGEVGVRFVVLFLIEDKLLESVRVLELQND